MIRPRPLALSPSAIHSVLIPLNVPVSTTNSGLMVVTIVAKKLQHFDLGGHGVEHAPSLRMRTLRSRAMIFRLEMVAAFDLPQDAVFLFFFFEETAQVEGHRREVYRRGSTASAMPQSAK